MPHSVSAEKTFFQYKSIDKVVNDPHGIIGEGDWCASSSLYLLIWWMNVKRKVEEIDNYWWSLNANRLPRKKPTKPEKRVQNIGGESECCLIQIIILNRTLVVEILVSHIRSLFVDCQHISPWVLFNVIQIVARHIVVVNYIINRILSYTARIVWRHNFSWITTSCCITSENAAIKFSKTSTTPFSDWNSIFLKLKTHHKHHHNYAY